MFDIICHMCKARHVAKNVRFAVYWLTHLAAEQPLPFCYEIPCEGK